MKTSIAFLCLCAAGGCVGEFGTVGRSTKISEGSRITANSIVPNDVEHRGVTEHLALAEEIYAKQLDQLRERRASLRTRHRSLTLASYATFAATTIVISAAAINKGSDATPMAGPDGGLKTAGYGALGGLGLGTTLEVVNLMQEDPANIEAKIRHLQSSYDTMVDRLREVFEDAPGKRRAAAPGEPPGADARSLELRAVPIIETFINEALQISIKG